MLQRLIFYCSLALFIAVTFFSFLLWRTSEKESPLYRSLAQNTKERRDDFLSGRAKAFREAVTKNFWFQEEERLAGRVESPTSELAFCHEGREIELVEYLENATCLFQEELYYLLKDGQEGKRLENGKMRLKNSSQEIDFNAGLAFPMQRLRFLKAKKAVYHYNIQLFEGEEVEILKYETKGHELPFSIEGLTPLMEGKADRVTFVLEGEKIDFKAEHFKATFEPKKGKV